MSKVVILASDGSAIRKPDREHWWCAGGFVARLYDGTEMVKEFSDVKKLDDSTNNIGELTGLEMAIDSMNVIEDESDVSFVFLLDSEYTLKSVTRWYSAWKRNMRDGIAYTASGTPVKNWEQIERIHGKLKAIRHKHVFKVRSHVPEKNYNKAYHEFCMVNDANVSYEMWQIFNQLNNACDGVVNNAAEELAHAQ